MEGGGEGMCLQGLEGTVVIKWFDSFKWETTMQTDAWWLSISYENNAGLIKTWVENVWNIKEECSNKIQWDCNLMGLEN